MEHVGGQACKEGCPTNRNLQNVVLEKELLAEILARKASFTKSERSII